MRALKPADTGVPVDADSEVMAAPKLFIFETRELFELRISLL